MKNRDQCENTIIGIAKQIINKEINLIDGCREMNRIGINIEDSTMEMLMIFRYIDSELDFLPLSENRYWYSDEYLRNADAQAALFISSIEEEVYESCKKIIERGTSATATGS